MGVLTMLVTTPAESMLLYQTDLGIPSCLLMHIEKIPPAPKLQTHTPLHASASLLHHSKAIATILGPSSLHLLQLRCKRCILLRPRLDVLLLLLYHLAYSSTIPRLGGGERFELCLYDLSLDAIDDT